MGATPPPGQTQGLLYRLIYLYMAWFESELEKVAILAIQDRGTLWESGEHFDQKIYALKKIEICHDLRTFETIFRLNVGNILDDWDRLRIIYLFFFCFSDCIFHLFSFW